MAAAIATDVLHSPDLARLVAQHLAVSDLVPLSQTSRNCFYLTIPFVWYELEGIHNLFRLVPGAQFTQTVDGKCQRLIIPNLLLADLTRLKIYAPLVRELFILPKIQSDFYAVPGFGHLLEFTRRYYLLPKLRVIISDCHHHRDPTFAHWVKPLLSSGVVKLYTHSHEGRFTSALPMRSASELLEQIALRSKDIERLSICPYIQPGASVTSGAHSGGGVGMDYEYHNSHQGNNGQQNGLGSHILPYYEYMRRLTRLRHLATSSIVLSNDALEVLANLPHLEKLELDCTFSHTYFSGSPQYSDNPFPSLRCLELRWADEARIQRVWSQQQLVRRLTKVVIEFRGASTYNYEDGDWDDIDDNYRYHHFFASFIPKMCERSPGIEELLFDFSCRTGNLDCPEIESLQALAVLPLRVLDLRNVEIEDSPATCGILAQCSSLRDLYLRDHRVSLKELTYYALIPQLENFHADIQWENTEDIDSLMSAQLQTPSNIQALVCEAVPYFSNDNILQDVARFLLTYFPNIDTVIKIPRMLDDDDMGAPVLLTNEINAIRGTSVSLSSP